MSDFSGREKIRDNSGLLQILIRNSQTNLFQHNCSGAISKRKSLQALGSPLATNLFKTCWEKKKKIERFERGEEVKTKARFKPLEGSQQPVTSNLSAKSPWACVGRERVRASQREEILVLNTDKIYKELRGRLTWVSETEEKTRDGRKTNTR
jgi:hypothetical protein